MSIPALTAEGLLPPGIFECSLGEVKQRFGAFGGSDRRVQLFTKLEEVVLAMIASTLFDSLIIDGSFVTTKRLPNDIDCIAVLRPGHDFERELLVGEYALVSRARLRRRFGFDVMVAEKDSSLYRTYVEFFSRVRQAPNLKKGMLRLRL
jgi:hypothetical protein